MAHGKQASKTKENRNTVARNCAEEHKPPLAHDMRFTLLKPYGTKRTSLLELSADEFVASLRDGQHSEAVMDLRATLPYSRGLSIVHTEIRKLGWAVPSCFYCRQKGRYVIKAFNGVVWLDVQDVYSPDDVVRLKRQAASMPTTLAVFLGSSGMSLKVLVRYWPEDGVMPRRWADMEALHQAAYHKAMTTYAALLGRALTPKADMSILDGFRLTIDPDFYWNEQSTPMMVSSLDIQSVEGEDRVASVARYSEGPGVPPADSLHYNYYNRRFMKAQTDVQQEFRQQDRDASIERQAFLEAVVARCFAMQIPVAETRAHILESEPEERATAWRHFVNDYYSQNAAPADGVSNAAGKVRAMQDLFVRNYELYRNEIDGALYYRPRTTNGRWHVLDRAKEAGMVLEAMEEGVTTSPKTVRTFLDSDRIPRRNPLREFLDKVRGQWDGKDRIGEMARCVAGNNPLWERAFHIWLLGMVQQWMGIHREHGNSVAPLLCGPQGTGKSTFCRSLLPDELMWGYLDHIDLAKREPLMRLMAQTLLINIDEFDQYRGEAQRGALKNLLQQADVRTRQMWRTNIQVRQRLASFIATCNPTEVLVDETGSRRFVCVHVTEPIRIPPYFSHFQLYAQAVDEIDMRRHKPNAYEEADIIGRCYFTDEEREAIENNNRHFRVQSYAVERFNDCFEMLPTRKLRGDMSTVELTRSEILEFLERHSGRKFSREDIRQLKAFLEEHVGKGHLDKHRATRTFVYHLRRKSMPII